MDSGKGGEPTNKKNRLNTLYRWFGSEDMEPSRRKELRQEGFIPPSQGNNALDTEAGMFIFFDALPVARVKLACDVMTPHYGDWYQGGGDIENVGNEPNKVPADWHSPVPVPFLVVKEANFLFSIAPRRIPHDDERKAEVAAELANVMLALKEALEYLGAGSKTAVGYGRMEEDEAAMDKRAKVAEQARMRELPAEERLRVEVARLTLDQLTTMFGKNYNKTYESRNEVWELFITLIRDKYYKEIQHWKDSSDKNKKKAYAKLTSQTSE